MAAASAYTAAGQWNGPAANRTRDGDSVDYGGDGHADCAGGAGHRGTKGLVAFELKAAGFLRHASYRSLLPDPVDVTGVLTPSEQGKAEHVFDGAQQIVMRVLLRAGCPWGHHCTDQDRGNVIVGRLCVDLH